MSIIFFALQNQLVIITIPRAAKQAQSTDTTIAKKNVVISYWKNQRLMTDRESLLWGEDDVLNAQRLIAAYWALLESEGITPLKIPIQSVTADLHNTMLICSLGATPSDPELSTYANWLRIEGLLKTIRDNLPRFQSFMLLVNHQPYNDFHISGLYAWPLEGFLDTTKTLKPLRFLPNHFDKKYIIVLDPAGDARATGRTIDNTFERSLTLQLSTLLSNELKQRFPNSHIIITRSTGDILEPLQNAASSNRLGADLYLHISMYATNEKTPELYAYTYRLHPVTDAWKQTKQPDQFTPYYRAHVNAAETSLTLAHGLLSALQQQPGLIAPVTALALPYHPLIGITAPALGIELGIQRREQWAPCVEQLANALEKIILTLPT